MSAGSDQVLTITYTSTSRPIDSTIITITSDARNAPAVTVNVSLGGAIGVD